MRRNEDSLLLVIARLAAALFGLLLAAVSHTSAAEVLFNSGWQFHRIDDGVAPDEPPAKAPWSTVSLSPATRIEPRIVNDQGIASYRKRFEAVRIKAAPTSAARR